MNRSIIALTLAFALGACNRAETTAPVPSSGGVAPPSAPSNVPPVAASAETPGPALVAEGTRAPPFAAKTHDGREVSLASLAGKVVVLYFYPKDDTPGCTIEATEFRDTHADFETAKAVVVGVSTDGLESHESFARKYDLPFTLLPDPDAVIARAYGVPLKAGHAKRVTFVIDRRGVIAKVFSSVDPRGHAAEILAVARGLP